MKYQLGVLAMYLSGQKLEELSFYKKLCLVGRQMGIEVLVFTPDDVDESRSRVLAITYSPSQKEWIRKRIAFPPLIYDRCRYRGAENYRKLSHFRRKYVHLHYISRHLANKWAMHEILSQHPAIVPHLPYSEKYRNPTTVMRMLQKHRTIFLKPRSGTGGRGIVRLQRADSGEAYVLQGREPNRRIIPMEKIAARKLPSRLIALQLTDSYIVQQGIPLELEDGRVHDFRMLLQKDGSGRWQVTGCAGRIGPRKSVTSNLHGGGTAVPMDALLYQRFGSAEHVALIKESAYTLGLNIVEYLDTKFDTFCEVGLDLAVDRRGHVWLLEVNPKPSREVFHRIGETVTYRNAIRRPLEFALRLLRQKEETQEGAFAQTAAVDHIPPAPDEAETEELQG